MTFSRKGTVVVQISSLDRDIPTIDLPPTPYPATGASGGLVRGASPSQCLSTHGHTCHRIEDKQSFLLPLPPVLMCESTVEGQERSREVELAWCTGKSNKYKVSLAKEIVMLPSSENEVIAVNHFKACFDVATVGSSRGVVLAEL